MDDGPDAALAGERERETEVAGQPVVAAAEDDGVDERLKRVDQAFVSEHRSAQVRAADGEVARARRLEAADVVGVDAALDARARGRRLRERGREHDLVGGPPQRGELSLLLE